MDNQTPKQMKKVHRGGVLHRVVKSLGKLEEGLSQSSSSHDFRSSFRSNLSTNYEHEKHSQDDDSISLQYYSNPSSHSPTAIIHHRPDHLLHQHSSPMLLNNTLSLNEPIVKNLNTAYDQEMRFICQELMENRSNHLYNCRDYDQKASLLRNAVSINTPQVTVPVILFLENTLSKQTFYDLLKQHPSAIKNYINLAKLRLDDEHYIAMLKHFGRNKNVAMIRIRQANEAPTNNNKIALLDQAAIELHSHPWWYSQVLDYQRLLRKQQELHRQLATVQPNIQLENQTLLKTYKIVFDIDFRQQKYKRNTDGKVSSRVKEIETEFNMSPEMIACGQLAVIMKCSFRTHYDDFVQHSMHQGIFGKKYVIAPENLAEMVYNWVVSSGEGKEKASKKAGEFLIMIQNPERKLYYAERFQNYDVAMDTIANTLRDRIQLENLRKRIPEDHPSFFRATSLLETTRWKN